MRQYGNELHYESSIEENLRSNYIIQCKLGWCHIGGIIVAQTNKKAPELTEALGCGMDETRTRNFRRDRPVL